MSGWDDLSFSETRRRGDPPARSHTRLASNAATARSEPDPAELFRTGDVLQLVGVSRRQLQYWSQTNLAQPSLRTPGGHHRYSFDDLVILKAVKRLIDAGVSVQRIRDCIRALRESLLDGSLALGEVTLVASGDVLLVLSRDTDFQALRGREWIFPIGEFRREVDAWRKLHAPLSVKRKALAEGRTGSAEGA